MKIVGIELNNRIIPYGNWINKSPEPMDVVFDEGHYFIIRSDHEWIPADERWESAVKKERKYG